MTEAIDIKAALEKLYYHTWTVSGATLSDMNEAFRADVRKVVGQVLETLRLSVKPTTEGRPFSLDMEVCPHAQGMVLKDWLVVRSFSLADVKAVFMASIEAAKNQDDPEVAAKFALEYVDLFSALRSEAEAVYIKAETTARVLQHLRAQVSAELQSELDERYAHPGDPFNEAAVEKPPRNSRRRRPAAEPGDHG